MTQGLRSTAVSLCVALAPLAFGGCDVGSAVAVDDQVTYSREMLTGLALAGASINGVFDMDPASKPAGARVSATEAASLAMAFILGHGRYFKRMMEDTHGEPIALSDLVVGRVYYAESPYPQREPSSDIAQDKRRGPFFLVRLDHQGHPAISVAVSALNDDLTIDESGWVQATGPRHGADFRLLGIPMNSAYQFPMSPERAVAITVDATGARVTQVPRLVRPLIGQGVPQLSRWELSLDRPVTVRLASGDAVEVVAHLAVDASGNLQIPTKTTMRPFGNALLQGDAYVTVTVVHGGES